MKGWGRWLGIGAAVVSVGFAAQAQQGSGPAFERVQHLQRGVNLSSFYAQARDYSPERLDGYMSTADMRALKTMGFDHVRLSIDPEQLIREAQNGTLRPAQMAQLSKTVQQLTDAGLNVILDMHPSETWKAAMTHNDSGAVELMAFWEQFAAYFAKTDPNRVFFEIMNEPSMDDLYRWEGIQMRVVAAIRKVAPQHTIIATAAAWGHQDGLLAMEPVRDDNVIYTFHDYDPMWFTHQGASWSAPEYAFLHGIPYPSTPENIQAVLSEEPDARAQLQLERYGEDRWDAQRVDSEVAMVAAWAQKHGVALYCGEFGAYKSFTDPQMRVAWIGDTRAALERHHVGWAMWDYDGNFGLATKTGAGIEFDQNVLHALGLGKQ